MLLSKKLTFYFVFSVLLIAALAFVVTPAMAEETVSYYATQTDETATADGKWEVFFKFDMGGSFPNKDVFKTVDTTQDPAVTTYNISLGGNVLTEAQFGAVTYESNKLTVPIAKNAGAPTDPSIAFTVQGYVAVSAFTADIAEAAAVDLDVAADHLAGKAYRVYARTAGSTNKASPDAGAPHLPTGVDAVLFPRTSAGTANADLPDDFEEFFNVGGGTIDLKLTDTAKDSRHIIINEIMWGVDNSQVGQAGYTYQQWIEVYNRTSIPVPDANISFAFENDTFPAPATAAGTSDRISNIAGYQNVWADPSADPPKPPIKGSSGTATRNDAGTEITGANPAFVSLFRKSDKQNADGTNAAHWVVSTRPYFPGFLGTPSSANTRGGLPTARPNPGAFTPPKDKVIINEVYNSDADADDWIELRNVSDAEVNLENWRLSHTGTIADADAAAASDEMLIIRFPKRPIKAGEILLIVNKDPIDSNLVAGQDITIGDRADQQSGAGPHKYLNVKRSHNLNLHIPDAVGEGGFLILRTPRRDDKKNIDTDGFGGSITMHDVVGPSRVSRKTLAAAAKIQEPETENYWNTDAWPINGHTGDSYRAHDADGSNNDNASLNPAADFENGKVWARSGTAHGWRKGGGGHVGFSGGVGYDRGYKGDGTPGYPNDLVKGKTTDVADGGLIISELMLTTDGKRYPQWIELHNTSRTQTINLAADGSDPKTGWQMIIENHNSNSWKDDTRPLTATINLKDFFSYIPPNQTVLIVSRSRNRTTGAGNFPSHRVSTVWGTKSARTALGQKKTTDPILNAAVNDAGEFTGGFYIKIVDGDGNVSDEIGNLDGKAADLRNEIPIDDPHSWKWPAKMTEDGHRTSLIRLMDGNTRGVQGTSFGTAGTPRKGVPKRDDDGNYVEGDNTGMVLPMGVANDRRGGGMVVMGMDADGNPVMAPAKYYGAAWIHAVDTASPGGTQWYGSSNDIGSPLHTTGTPLPVELSHFRPTLENGQVVIRWTTESELDNAGFNILRSDTRDGEYKQVNAQMIQGHGTTGERHTYKWVDETAKPNVVYYYQIEDVSFAGERQTLQTTKLKGLISARGKATTTWGDIKEVQ